MVNLKKIQFPVSGKLAEAKTKVIRFYLQTFRRGFAGDLDKPYINIMCQRERERWHRYNTIIQDNKGYLEYAF